MPGGKDRPTHVRQGGDDIDGHATRLDQASLLPRSQATVAIENHIEAVVKSSGDWLTIVHYRRELTFGHFGYRRRPHANGNDCAHGLGNCDRCLTDTAGRAVYHNRLPRFEFGHDDQSTPCRRADSGKGRRGCWNAMAWFCGRSHRRPRRRSSTHLPNWERTSRYLSGSLQCGRFLTSIRSTFTASATTKSTARENAASARANCCEIDSRRGTHLIDQMPALNTLWQLGPVCPH